MALDLATLQARRDALIEGIVSDTLEVQFENRKKVFRSVAQMKEALTFLDDEIAKAGGNVGSRVGLAQHKRGDGPIGQTPQTWDRW